MYRLESDYGKAPRVVDQHTTPDAGIDRDEPTVLDVYKRPTTHSRYKDLVDTISREDIVDIRTIFYDTYQERLESLRASPTADMVAHRTNYYRDFVNDHYLSEEKCDTPQEVIELRREKAFAKEMISMSERTFTDVLNQMYGSDEQEDDTPETAPAIPSVRRLHQKTVPFTRESHPSSIDDTSVSAREALDAARDVVLGAEAYLRSLAVPEAITPSGGHYSVHVDIDDLMARTRNASAAPAVRSSTSYIDIDNLISRSHGDVSVTDTSSTGSVEVRPDITPQAVDTAYQDAATAFASRMRASVMRRGKKADTQDMFGTKLDELEELLTGSSNAQLATLQADGVTGDELAKRMAAFETTQTSRLARTQHNAMLGKYEQNPGRLARIRKLGRRAMDAYANASTSKKIAVGIGVGAATAVAGVAAASVGGAMAIAGGVGLGGARMFRAYSLSRAKLYERTSSPTIDSLNKDGSHKTPQEIMAEGARLRRAASLDRITVGDKQKKLALGVTAVSAVLFGAGAVHLASEYVDTVRGWFGGHGETAHAATSPIVETPPPQIDVPETSFDVSQFADAQTITPGEGWYQTFGELGIAPHDQARLLNDDILMAKLSNMGVAYPDVSLGGWGMNMTVDGKLPTDALKLIHDTAAQSGMVVR
ncbi:MAG: hypothetical protein WAS27_00575 [Candidatus Saccharimonadales bacterium]